MQVKLPIKHAGGGHWIFRSSGIEKSHREVRLRQGDRPDAAATAVKIRDTAWPKSLQMGARFYGPSILGAIARAC